MTKGEKRKARKALHRVGKPLTGELALDHDSGSVEFTETHKGRKALNRWAKAYDDRNGAPEGDWDR